ncbi:hypothetical protein JW964_09155 [candidate division KSB1 bacterium]|nr:hypothetical protein [candidate division KSB1 bacterium]
MHFSIHYYVLTLGKTSNKLYEGFRDMLIEIRNDGFPLKFTPNVSSSANLIPNEKRLWAFYKKLDHLFTTFYIQDPLGLILIGERRNQSIFRAISPHDKNIIGTLEGNYETTSARDLGQIVWPIIREALSGNRERALRKLNQAVSAHKVVSGLEEVLQSANSGRCSDLLVEENYHLKGSIVETGVSWMILQQVDLREVFDDVVDNVIEKVLKTNGTVIFLENGTLASFKRIALILHE